MKTLLQKKHLLLLFILTSMTSISQNVNIPDYEFKQALLNYVPTIDLDNNGEISIQEAILINSLDVSRKNINSLSGIESFTNLENLNCIGNNLTSLNLISLIKLTYLDCYRNQISNLLLPTTNSLSQVNCSDNNISSFDLSNLSGIKSINIARNQLTNLTFSQTNNLDLNRVWCNNNNLTTIDISGLDNLILFSCSYNLLSTIKLPNDNNILQTFSCTNNNLTNLNTSKIKSVSTFDCNDNLLTELDLSQNKSITRLFAYNNSLTKLNFKNGINSSIYGPNFYVRNNPDLKLICVDDVNYANTNFTQKDAQSYFSDICSFIPESSNTITGTVSFDFDGNGCDLLDQKFSNSKIISTGTNTSNVSFTDNNGQYLLYTTEANNTLDIFANLPNFFTVTPISQNVNFTGTGSTQVVDFCITANAAVNDVKVSVLPITESRPGFQTTVRVLCENVGTTIISGDINLTFDDLREVFIGATETTTSQTNNSITWSYTNLKPFDKKIIDVTFEVNRPTDPVNPANNGDTLSYTCNVNSISEDVNLENNTNSFNDVIIGSYDPNDIIALEGNYIKDTQVSDFLNYRIRFQNTGTASAINVVVKNELDSDLDWDSFQPITASHDYRISITDDNKVDFIFENIHLADSTSNEPASHGWIYYKIKPKSTFAIGDVIENTANIYFDFNFPVTTNTFTTQIEEPIAPPIPNLKAKVFPNPTRKYANIKVNLKGKLVVYNKYGVKVFKHRLKKGVNKFNFGWLRSGRYYLKIKSKNQVIYKNLVKKKNRRGQNHH